MPNMSVEWEIYLTHNISNFKIVIIAKLLSCDQMIRKNINDWVKDDDDIELL